MNLTILSLRSGMATSWQGVEGESNIADARLKTESLVQPLPQGTAYAKNWTVLKSLK
jgi:hypothetical protein